jgi:hypothetical protein
MTTGTTDILGTRMEMLRKLAHETSLRILENVQESKVNLLQDYNLECRLCGEAEPKPTDAEVLFHLASILEAMGMDVEQLAKEHGIK